MQGDFLISTDLSPDCYKDVRINNKKSNDAQIHRNIIATDEKHRKNIITC